MMFIISILLTSLIGMIAFFGKDLSDTLKKIQEDIKEISKIVSSVSTGHDDLKDRMSNAEKHIEDLMWKNKK